MSNILGKVIDKASTEEFIFVSSKDFNTSYVIVKMDHILGDGRLVGEITEKQAINPYFERPSTFNYVAENDESIKSQSLYIAKVKPIACIRGNIPEDVQFPPLPGSNVIEADDTDIRNALRLPEQGIDIGILKGSRSLEIRVSPNQLVRTHTAILGQTGSGKSYLAFKIALEILKLRDVAQVPSELPIPLVLDSSGEYSGKHNLGEQGCLAEVMSAISITDYSFPLLNEKYLPLLFDIFEINERQESDLRAWLGPLSEKNWDNTVSEESGQVMRQFHQMRISSTKNLADQIEDSLKKFNKHVTSGKVSIPYNALRKLRRLNVRIRRTEDADFTESLANGLIVDLSDQTNFEERQISVLLLMRQIYEAKKAKRLPFKLLIFLDEAHNYVPSVYKSICKDEILRMAREGRKYGISLCLISQRPRWVDPTALSQCGNVFIFRIQNSDDKKHIFDSASLPDSARYINTAKFHTGDVIITGDVVGHTITCSVSQVDNEFIKARRKRIANKYLSEIRQIVEK